MLADRRRGALLSYKGYLFARNRTRGNKTYWRCIDTSCSVFMHTTVVQMVHGATVGHVDIKKEPPSHSHPPCDESIQRREMVKDMIALVQADPCASLRSSYDSVTAQSSCGSAYVMDEAVPTLTSVQSLRQQRRSECFPPITRADVDV